MERGELKLAPKKKKISQDQPSLLPDSSKQNFQEIPIVPPTQKEIEERSKELKEKAKKRLDWANDH